MDANVKKYLKMDVIKNDSNGRKCQKTIKNGR